MGCKTRNLLMNSLKTHVRSSLKTQLLIPFCQLIVWSSAVGFEVDPLSPEIARASTESVHTPAADATGTFSQSGLGSLTTNGELEVSGDSARPEYQTKAAFLKFSLQELTGDLNSAALELTPISSYPVRQRVGVFVLQNSDWEPGGTKPDLIGKLPVGVFEIPAGAPGPARLVLPVRTLQPFLKKGSVTILLQRQNKKTIFLDEPGAFKVASSRTTTPPRLILSRGPKTKLQAALDEGLPVWRKPDVNASSCADCHGPSGLDLALLDYDVSGDIRRRALGHVSSEEADVIGRLVSAWREHLGLNEANPALDHFTPLFQPGGEKLPGANRLENDKIFAQNLVSKGLDAAIAPVNSYAGARTALQELLELNAWDLKVGFDMPAWTHDPAHGSEHALLTEWIPIYPSSPKPESKDFLFALHDAYMANASHENLWQLVHWSELLHVPDGFFPGDPNVNADTGGAKIGINQYLSILSVQHHLLMEKAGGPLFIDTKNPISTQWANQRFSNDTPAQFWWQVADQARVHQTFANDNSSSLNTKTGFPVHELAKINSTDFATEFSATSGSPRPMANRHLADLRAKFFWLAWLVDPVTMSSGRSNATRSLEYMEQSYSRNFPAHFSLVWLKRLAMSRFVPESRADVTTFSFYGATPTVGAPNSIGTDPLDSGDHYVDQEHLALCNILADNITRIPFFVLENDLHSGYAHLPLKEHTLTKLDQAETQAAQAGTLTPALQRAISTIRNYYLNDIRPPAAGTAAANLSSTSGSAPFTLTASTSAISGAEYGWDYGDDTFSASRTATHTYQKPGTYQLKLSVMKADGSAAFFTRTITVTGTPVGLVNFQVSPEFDRGLRFQWSAAETSKLPEGFQIEVTLPGRTFIVEAMMEHGSAFIQGLPAGTTGSCQAVIRRGNSVWRSATKAFMIPTDLQEFASERNISEQEAFTEYAFGTDPTSGFSAKKTAAGVTARPAFRALRPNLRYTVQRSKDLITWETISTGNPRSGDAFQIEDTRTTDTHYFYRNTAEPK